MNFTDQIGHTVQLENSPKRIVSLVPSQTELLYDLGLTKEVVGITNFCIYPQGWFKNKTKIGGTKKIKISKIKQLNTDLIIANKEENTREQIEQLQQYYRVWTSDINNLQDALNMIKSMGEITNTEKKATLIIHQIQMQFNDLLHHQKPNKNVLYLIWKNPYMSVGKHTFIDDMLMRCGLKNIVAKQNRYPILTEKFIKQVNADVILLSSEPYPFKEKHMNNIKKISPDAKIILVDGEMFSWYGSRLQLAPKYFVDLINEINSKTLN